MDNALTNKSFINTRTQLSSNHVGLSLNCKFLSVLHNNYGDRSALEYSTCGESQTEIVIDEMLKRPMQ